MLSNYKNAVDSIQAPEDLKERTAQMMKQPFEAPSHKRPVWKAAACLAMVGVIALGVVAIPRILKPVVAVAPAAQSSTGALTSSMAEKLAACNFQVVKMKSLALSMGWIDEDKSKPATSNHRKSTILESTFQVVGENIEQITYSVDKGKFQQRVRLPDSLFKSKSGNDFEVYAKANGLESYLTTIQVDAKGKSIPSDEYVDNPTFINYGYKAEQNSSYTIKYEDQTDFAKQYGYRMTISKSEDWFAYKKGLDSPTLTITVQYKDGSTAKKQMKLVSEGIHIIAVEKNTPSPSGNSSTINASSETKIMSSK